MLTFIFTLAIVYLIFGCLATASYVKEGDKTVTQKQRGIEVARALPIGVALMFFIGWLLNACGGVEWN